ncbi:MAG: aldolase [Alphaproteobacteria bacterium]|nr:aldolase [Alphaproteobacteria bacterium]
MRREGAGRERDAEPAAPPTRHGTAIARAGPAGVASGVAAAGVLLRGPAGVGKSDLAFRMIDAGRARLVADDRVVVTPGPGPDAPATLSAPAALAGRIELRGLGVVRLEAHEVAPAARLLLIVDLVPRDTVPRLPAPDPVELCGVAAPRLRLCAFDASTPAKILRALRLIETGAGGVEDGIGPARPPLSRCAS